MLWWEIHLMLYQKHCRHFSNFFLSFFTVQTCFEPTLPHPKSALPLKNKKYQGMPLSFSVLCSILSVCAAAFSPLTKTAFCPPKYTELRSPLCWGLCLCSALPSRPPDCPDWAPPTVFTPRGRCRGRNGRVGGGPCEAAAPSEQPRAAALFGGSRIEMGPAQWKCQREPEISPRDWWAFCSSLLKRCLSHLEGAYRRELAKEIYLWSRRQRVSAFFSSARVWSGASAIVRAVWRSSIWGFSLDVRVFALQLDGATL